MRRLTKKEKYFVSCFVEECNHLLHPTLGKTISLYTFLDGTSESLEEQKQQIKHHDPLLSKILFAISNRVDDEIFYNKKIKELQQRGFSASLHFATTFRSVSEWLWLVESDIVRNGVRKDFDRKKEEAERRKKIFTWPRSDNRKSLFTWSRSGNIKTFAPDKSIAFIASAKIDDVNDDAKEKVEKPFDFEKIKEHIQNKSLSHLRILQILDRASSLGLTADQIIFLQTVYKTSLEEISGSTQSVYVVDSQGRATFENQDLEKYKRAFASEEEKIKALNDDRSHGSRAARPPSTQRAPATRPAKVGQPRKPHLRTQEIYYDHFFCKRCITPFEAPKGKQKILCPCCGGEIGRSSKIT